MSQKNGMNHKSVFIVNFSPISCSKVKFEHFHNVGGLRIYVADQDQRDVPEAYLHWYCSQMEDILDVRHGIYQELITVLGDRYDLHRIQTFIKQLEESSDVNECIKKLMVPLDNESQRQSSSSPGASSSSSANDDNSNNINRLPESAEHILRDFCERGGLELPQALERLVQILGPGSDSLSGKLLNLWLPIHLVTIGTLQLRKPFTTLMSSREANLVITEYRKA